MLTYLGINIGIIIVPLAYSFEKNVRFYKKYPGVLFSTITTGLIFIIWDIIFAVKGNWSFNEEYYSGITLFSLPLEELLFFITVPYSVIFIYEVIKFYIKEKRIELSKYGLVIIGLLLLISSFLFRDKEYTSIVFLFSGIVLIILPNISDYLKSSWYWILIGVSYIPFMAVNMHLTYLPVVTYHPESIIGIRFISIPIEDFFYSFVLLTLYYFTYRLFEQWKPKRKRLS